MDRFGPTAKVSKKLVHLLRWSSFPGRTGLNFGRMDRAHCLGRPAGGHAGVVYLIYSQKARMSRIYYLRNRSLLGLFAA